MIDMEQQPAAKHRQQASGSQINTVVESHDTTSTETASMTSQRITDARSPVNTYPFNPPLIKLCPASDLMIGRLNQEAERMIGPRNSIEDTIQPYYRVVKVLAYTAALIDAHVTEERAATAQRYTLLIRTWQSTPTVSALTERTESTYGSYMNGLCNGLFLRLWQ